jgi:beta-lactamase regulating signal transducer with metallopeptidase domain
MPTSTEELIFRLAQATVVLAASALVIRGLIRLLRPASPAVQRIAWLLVLVQGIVLVRFPIHVPWYEPEPADASPPVLGPAIEPWTASRASAAASEPRLPASAAVPGTLDPPTAESAPASEPWNWPQAMFVVWVAGMLLVPAYGIARYVRFLRRIGGADFGEDAWAAQWRQLLTARGTRGRIPLRVTRDAGPALCLLPSGYQVLVPADVWRGLSEGQREGVLRHELAHYERGDLWKSLLVRLLALPHWFNPLAWWAVRKFDECTEWLCDDAAIANRPDGHDFAQALVYLGTLASPQASTLNAARGGRLFYRIRRLVAAQPAEDSKMKKTLLLVGTSILLLLGAFRIQLVAKERAEARGATAPAQPPQAPKPASQAPAGRAVATRAAGTGQTERSIAAALAWLARHQAPDGSWSLQGYRKTCKDQSCTGPGSIAADAGATAMALLPFLAAGQTHESKGPYQQTIWKGLYWLMQHQKADGDLSAGAHGGPMYAHGLATIALCEAYGMSKKRDRQLGEKAQRGVNFILAAQHAVTGGWRYNPGDDGDTSVLGCQVMALKSAQMAGLNVDRKAFDGAQRFLRSCATGQHGGQFSYRPNQKATPSMTAVGLLCCQDLGIKRGDPSIVEGTAVLMANMPDKAQNPRDFYYWFFATQVMHNVSGPDRDKWNRQVRQALIEVQCKDDCAAGSWDPEKPTPVTWSQQGGRVMVTSLAALTLEVYYRYLPSFKLDVGPEASPSSAPKGP